MAKVSNLLQAVLDEYGTPAPAPFEALFAAPLSLEADAPQKGDVIDGSAPFSHLNIVEIDGVSYVTIDASATDGDGAALHAALKELGLIGGGSYHHLASGLLPVDAIAMLDGLDTLAVATASLMRSSVGSVTTRDDVAVQADAARTAFGVDGTGVTVGILSDAFDTGGLGGSYAADIASGDLPDDVLILQEFSGVGIDEGRAMAQLVHDLAPGADLQFATAFEGMGLLRL